MVFLNYNRSERDEVTLRKEFNMATVITFASEKGGVSKTTTCVNLATCLTQKGYRVLVCDMDAQANSTYLLTGHIKKEDFYKGLGVYDMLRAYDIKSPEDFIVDSHVGDLCKVLPSNLQTPLAIGQLELLQNENGCSKNQFFMFCLAKLSSMFDFILCDTGPARDSLILSAITASDYVILPTVCNSLALEGFDTTCSIISKLEKQENTQIDILGILLTSVEDYALTRAIRKSLQKSDYSDKLFKTEIRKGQHVNESSIYGKPVVITAPKAKPSLDYLALTEELLKRLEEKGVKTSK